MPKGQLDPDKPVDAYWRWYNVDGHKKPLNLLERMMAYGVKSVEHDGPSGAYHLQTRRLSRAKDLVDLDSQGQPGSVREKSGGRWVKLVYVYLEVDDSGILPEVHGHGHFRHTTSSPANRSANTSFRIEYCWSVSASSAAALPFDDARRPRVDAPKRAAGTSQPAITGGI